MLTETVALIVAETDVTEVVMLPKEVDGTVGLENNNEAEDTPEGPVLILVEGRLTDVDGRVVPVSRERLDKLREVLDTLTDICVFSVVLGTLSVVLGMLAEVLGRLGEVDGTTINVFGRDTLISIEADGMLMDTLGRLGEVLGGLRDAKVVRRTCSAELRRYRLRSMEYLKIC